MIQPFAKFVAASIILLVAAQAEVSVTPDPATLTIHSGDTSTLEFNLENTSNVAATTWEASLAGAGGELQEVLDGLDEGFASATALIPSRYDFTDGVTGTAINDGGGDMYDTGNRSNTTPQSTSFPAPQRR